MDGSICDDVKEDMYRAFVINSQSFQARSQSREKRLLQLPCLSARLSTCINSSTSGEIFVKFRIGEFY